MEGHSDQPGSGQRADEAVALPLRKQLAVIDQQAGRRDGRHPPQFRRLERWGGRWLGNWNAIVVLTLRNVRPPVIAALEDQVEFVPAPRTHLGLPQPALSVEGEAVGIAVAVAPGFGRREVRPRPAELAALCALRGFAVARGVGD